MASIIEKRGGQKLSDTLREILSNSEIDSNLSINDILNCSNVISLLSYNYGGNMIQDTGVRLYSFPDINKFILLKLKVSDQVVEVSEEDKRGNIIKHFFFFLNPY